MIHGVSRGVSISVSGASVSELCWNVNSDCTDDMMQCSETKTAEGGGAEPPPHLFRNKDELKALLP